MSCKGRLCLCVAATVFCGVACDRSTSPSLALLADTSDTVESATEEDPFADPPTLAVGGGARLQTDSKVYTWSAGQPPAKMIHKTEGFALLTSIEGKFDAATDRVRVYLGPDGFWYLHGSADKEDQVRATAMTVRFVTDRVASSGRTPIDESATEREPPVRRVPDEGKHIEVRLPGRIDGLCVGGGGDYLVLRLGGLRKLVIFETREARIARYLPVDEDALIAAGMKKLVLLNGKQGILQRYDLASGQRELAVVSPVPSVQCMATGCASDGPLLVTARDKSRHGYDELVFIDVQSLKVTPVDVKGERFGMWINRIWASADAAVFGLGALNSSSDATVLKLRGPTATIRSNSQSRGYLMPSMDGRILFTSDGLFDDTFQPINRKRQYVSQVGAFLPCPYAAYYLGISDSGRDDIPDVAIYSLTDHQRLLILPELPELSEMWDSYSHQGGLDWDQRLHVLPDQQRIVTIPSGRDRLLIRKFDLLAELKAADVDYLFVSSIPPSVAAQGEEYRYRLRIESRRGKIQCKLESGPTGMTLSDDAVLSWTPAKTLDDDEFGVIISISDASGQEIFHSFLIRVNSH